MATFLAADLLNHRSDAGRRWWQRGDPLHFGGHHVVFGHRQRWSHGASGTVVVGTDNDGDQQWRRGGDQPATSSRSTAAAATAAGYFGR